MTKQYNYEPLTNLECSPQLVTLPSSQAQPSRDPVNASYLQTQPRSYPPTTVTPSSLHNAITPTPYYSTSVVPPPTRQKTQVPAQLQPSRPASAQSTRSTSSSGSVSTPSSRILSLIFSLIFVTFYLPTRLRVVLPGPHDLLSMRLRRWG